VGDGMGGCNVSVVTGRVGGGLCCAQPVRGEDRVADHVSRYDSKEDAGSAEEMLFVTRLGLTPESVVVDSRSHHAPSGSSPYHAAPWSPSQST
jgi:hypothetical protein